MKIFQCQQCNNPVFFENTVCKSCGYSLAYLDEANDIFALDNRFTSWKIFPHQEVYYQYCSNFSHQACNWLVPVMDGQDLCAACQLNRTIPNVQNIDDLEKWQRLERAKHRLIYSLQRFNLPIKNKIGAAENGLAFDFLSNEHQKDGEPPVRTGHANGVITLNIAEADSAHREQMRQQMGEPYRTLIGHFRHEVGHYYWDLLVKSHPKILSSYREKFGDERLDYGDSLQKYYQQGAPANWQDFFISEYATAHAWEDWAETWAHYLHLVDTLETAYVFGLSLYPNLNQVAIMNMKADFNPYEERDFDKIMAASISLTFAVNSLNRSMGQPDLYPFVLNKSVVEKLRFIHELLR